MTVEYLKRGKPDVERAEDDAKTKAIVEVTLKDIELRRKEKMNLLRKILLNLMTKILLKKGLLVKEDPLETIFSETPKSLVLTFSGFPRRQKNILSVVVTQIIIIIII